MISPDGDEEGDKHDVEGREHDEAIRMAIRSTTDADDVDWDDIGAADGVVSLVEMTEQLSCWYCLCCSE